MNKLQELFLDFEKAKSKHLIALLDTLHEQSFELPSYKIKNFAETLEKEIKNYNKHNKAQLELYNEVKSYITTITIYILENNKPIELCSFKMQPEPEIEGISINDITTHLKSFNEKELEMSAKRRDFFLEIIQQYVDTYCIYYDDVEKLNLLVRKDPVDPFVHDIRITQKINDEYQTFSKFTINEIQNPLTYLW